MKITEVIGYLDSYDKDAATGKFNPVQYLGLAKVSGFTRVRDKDTGEIFLIDRHGCYKSYNDMSYGRKPDAAIHLTGDYEFYSKYRVYSVGYLVPKEHDISLTKAFDIKDQIIGKYSDSGIDGVGFFKCIKINEKDDDTFAFNDKRDTCARFAEFKLFSAERLHEINKHSNLIGQTDTIPYDTNIPNNAICIIITTSDSTYSSNIQERVDNTWLAISKMFHFKFDVIRFAECDCGHHSN